MPSGASEPEEIELEEARSAKGDFLGYKPTLSNVVAILEHHERWAGRVLLNELAGQIEIIGSRGPRQITDAQAHEVRVWLDTGVKWSAKPSRSIAFDALETVAHRAAYHPIRDYLSSLQWDGVERLPFWLSDVCGVERTAYTMAVAAKSLIGAVARVLSPGCKLDTMPVLIGAQGIQKSTLVRVLFRGGHVDTPIQLGSKDAYQVLQGAWGYEFAELASFHGREVEKLKAFFSSSHDTYRPSYGRFTVSVPRQCVFWATTNDAEIFHDTTGARRFWPVEIEHVDIELAESLRDQLWAEAVAQFHAGEPWHMEGEAAELAANAAEQHHASDPWEGPISAFVEGKDRVPTADILDALGVEKARWTKGDSMRVTRVMRDRLKWKRQAIRVGGQVVKGFRRQ